MADPLIMEAQRLLNRTVRLRQELLHSQGDEAPNFNLFRILGVDAKEVSTHSAFLGHLLTPGATHAQGDLFLRAFLSGVAGLKLPSTNDWVVTRELPFASGRLDIVLRSVAAKVLIVVENKIDTQDSEGQLTAYRSWLDASLRRKTYNTRLLLYLTADGDEAKHSANIDYKRIAYSNEISAWLSDCQCRVKPPGLKNTLDAYLKTIGSMKAKVLTHDDLDEKILNLVTAPGTKETLIAALRIARVTRSLREEALRTFWTTGLTYLKKMCAEAGLKQWSVDPYGSDSFQGRRAIILTVRGVPEGKPHPQFSFNQYVGDTLFRWEWGVKFDAWVGKNDKIKKLPEALKCATVMEEALEMPKRRTWDGYRLLTDDVDGMDRTLEAELAKGTEISEFFEGGWKVFQQLEPQLRKLNSAVQRQIG